MGERRNGYTILVVKCKGKRSVGNPDVDGRILLILILKKCVVVHMDCFPLMRDSDRWQDHMNTVMKLRSAQEKGNFLSS
jgi:hypothetical protein